MKLTSSSCTPLRPKDIRELRLHRVRLNPGLAHSSSSSNGESVRWTTASFIFFLPYLQHSYNKRARRPPLLLLLLARRYKTVTVWTTSRPVRRKPHLCNHIDVCSLPAPPELHYTHEGRVSLAKCRGHDFVVLLVALVVVVVVVVSPRCARLHDPDRARR